MILQNQKQHQFNLDDKVGQHSIQQSQLTKSQQTQISIVNFKQKNKPSVHSQAYPVLDQQQIKLNQKNNKNVIKLEVHSQVHQKLRNMNFSLQKHKYPILLRKWKKQDIVQLKKLQKQWFPIRYSDQFYTKIQRNQVYCIIAETIVCPEDFTEQQRDHQTSQYETQFSKINNCNQEKQQNQQTTQNIDLKQQHNNTHKQKIIVGAAVFSISDSQGYSNKSLMKYIFSIFAQVQDSIYIMTLGVIDEFRKKGVGKLLINQILQSIKQHSYLKLIYLHVVSYNKAAINFYKRIGFSKLDHLNNFYHIAGKEYDGEVYGMFINEGKEENGWKLWIKKLFR